MEETLRV
jgi:hypothetical protein